MMTRSPLSVYLLVLLAGATMHFRPLRTVIFASSAAVESASNDSCDAATTRGGRRRKRLRVLLVRHGESENNVLHEVSLDHYETRRSADPELTELGRAQASATAEFLTPGDSDHHPLLLAPSIDEILVSPTKRTLATAAPIAAVLPKARTRVWTRIHEVGGLFDENNDADATGGVTRSALRELHPSYEIPDDLDERGWYDGSAGQETFDAAVERLRGVAATLRTWAADCGANGTDRTIALVAHGEMINVLLQILMFTTTKSGDGHDHDHDDFVVRKKAFHSYNAALHLVDVYETGETDLLFHNNVVHLLERKLCKLDKLGIV